MIEAVDRAGVLCFPFQGIMRLRGADVKRRIDAGEIGDLIAPAPDQPLVDRRGLVPSGTAGLVRRSGAGAGRRVHRRGDLLDRLLPVADRERDRAGRGEVANLVHKDIAVEDWGMATFTFANGVIATLEASWTINAPRRAGRRRSRTASCGWRSSARAARSSINGSARRGGRCWRPAPRIGSSSGSRRNPSHLQRPSL